MLFRSENIHNLPSVDAFYLSEYEGITVCVTIKRSNMAWVSQRILHAWNELVFDPEIIRHALM